MIVKWAYVNYYKYLDKEKDSTLKNFGPGT